MPWAVVGSGVRAVQYHSIDTMTMTLWPPQDQANSEMWAEYKRKTARPGLLEEEAAKQAELQALAAPPSEPVEITPRRGRLSETPQPVKDA